MTSKQRERGILMYAPTKANECPLKNSRTGRLDPASFGPHFLREHMFIFFSCFRFDFIIPHVHIS